MPSSENSFQLTYSRLIIDVFKFQRVIIALLAPLLTFMLPLIPRDAICVVMIRRQRSIHVYGGFAEAATPRLNWFPV